MSGGSYDYACFARELDELLGHVHNLEALRDRLAGLPYARAAAVETERLVAKLRSWEVQARVAAERLGPVWHAVEWWDSCDSGEDRVREAVENFLEISHDSRLTSEP
jgi:hypothetical protein